MKSKINKLLIKTQNLMEIDEYLYYYLHSNFLNKWDEMPIGKAGILQYNNSILYENLFLMKFTF